MRAGRDGYPERFGRPALGMAEGEEARQTRRSALVGGEASRWTGALRGHEDGNSYKDGAEGKVPERRYGRSMDVTVKEAETEGGDESGKKGETGAGGGCAGASFSCGGC